ncbi:hypothetical protein HGRIS_012380 [Hohenbuehelia grisea]|uniref:Uncharacterized protein n=1 Tax=Hohenbuehelia grisea TaxID=104357 RepID=A0ABR3IS31_9AGAR
MKMRENDLVPIVERCKHFKPTRPVVVNSNPEQDEELFSDRAATPDENEKEADLVESGMHLNRDRTTDEVNEEADLGGYGGEVFSDRQLRLTTTTTRLILEVTVIRDKRLDTLDCFQNYSSRILLLAI